MREAERGREFERRVVYFSSEVAKAMPEKVVDSTAEFSVGVGGGGGVAIAIAIVSTVVAIATVTTSMAPERISGFRRRSGWFDAVSVFLVFVIVVPVFVVVVVVVVVVVAIVVFFALEAFRRATRPARSTPRICEPDGGLFAVPPRDAGESEDQRHRKFDGREPGAAILGDEQPARSARDAHGIG